MLIVYRDELNSSGCWTIDLDGFDCIEIVPVREKWWHLPYGYKVVACNTSFLHRKTVTICGFASGDSFARAQALARDISEQWNKGVRTFDLYPWVSRDRDIQGEAIQMSIRNTTSTNIFRILRTCMGLSLKEMSERCKISAIYLNELELGKKTKPSDDIIQRLANACGIKPQTISFFIEQQQAESLDYQKFLLESLEQLANKLQQPSVEE